MHNQIKKEKEIKRIRTLIKKVKGRFKEREELADFKEPVLYLERRGRKVEFYENINQNEFSFEHSSGDNRKIILGTRFLKTFDYAGKTYKGYICHEDYPFPLPEDPLLTAETFGITIEKVLSDYDKWKTKQLDAKANIIWKVFVGIALIIGVVIVGYLVAPEFFNNLFNGSEVAGVVTPSTDVPKEIVTIE